MGGEIRFNFNFKWILQTFCAALINGALNIVRKCLAKLKVADESFVKGIVGRGLFARPHIITF